ncbi:MAG: hypothetical protein SCABRO_02554 [Candidatus Scalindua brodae]|uniref:Uncharacterized protein n=1 Tax=Candidatus Scalindua brodae TaxID=237368 RepID=A0A0B0EKQ5_9BACT|nr:MAG: hypothetical protein SCABRO_02554 [Candidatus Scalindua brodae]
MLDLDSGKTMTGDKRDAEFVYISLEGKIIVSFERSGGETILCLLDKEIYVYCYYRVS